MINLKSPPEIITIATGIHRGGISGTYPQTEHWAFHLYTYDADLEIDSDTYKISNGMFSLIPPGCTPTFHFGSTVCQHLYALFRLNNVSQTAYPLIAKAGIEFDSLWRIFRDSVAQYAQNPARSQAGLWELLWRVTELKQGNLTAKFDAEERIRKVCEYIELNLQANIRIPKIAKSHHISHNQLLRDFQKHFGCSLREYIYERRMYRAETLLTQTTHPIKAIAIDCGFPDLQHFNKAVRKRFGRSPRVIRSEGS